MTSSPCVLSRVMLVGFRAFKRPPLSIQGTELLACKLSRLPYPIVVTNALRADTVIQLVAQGFRVLLGKRCERSDPGMSQGACIRCTDAINCRQIIGGFLSFRSCR